MKCRAAGLALLVISILLAALLLTKEITVFTACIVFAIALCLLGTVSRGYSRR